MKVKSDLDFKKTNPMCLLNSKPLVCSMHYLPMHVSRHGNEVARNSPPRSSQATRLSAVEAPPRCRCSQLDSPNLKLNVSISCPNMWTLCVSHSHHPDSKPPTAALVGSMSCFSCFSSHPPMRITNSPFLS